MHQSRVLDFLSNTIGGSGTALLFLIAFWNSLRAEVHENAAKFGYDTWRWVYHDVFAGNDFAMAVFGTFVVTTVWFWLINVLFLIADITNQPEFFVRYKVQPDKNAPVHIPTLINCVRVVLRNQIIIGIPFNVASYYLLRFRGCSMLPEEMPSFHRVIAEILVFTIIEEIGFYYTHLLLHQPYFYKRIHKKHHEWTAPIGLVALYCDPSEYILSNLAPVVLGPLILGSHVTTQLIWLLLALMTTSVTHSGYHLPFLISPEFHDFHHANFNSNYGVIGLLDWLHGTDRSFTKSVASKRHRFLLGFKPIRSLFPDAKSNKNE